jgi:hypothetical protein
MQLLNGTGPFFCNFLAILCHKSAEKVAHHCVVFLNGDMHGAHRGVAPLLQIGQLSTDCKSVVRIH